MARAIFKKIKSMDQSNWTIAKAVATHREKG